MEFVIILLLIGLFIMMVFFLKNYFTLLKVKRIQKKNNVIVFGHKGKGKDLLFQWFVNCRKKETYISNVDYGHKRIPLDLFSDTDLANDFNNFINTNVNIAKKNPSMEGIDLYISDSGVYLPSTHDTALHKRYKSMPIFYALSRHLYNSNVHCNVQNIERLWKALREQADYFIKADGVIKLPHFLIVKCIGYDTYQDALANLKPVAVKVLDKNESATQKEILNSGRGEIVSFFVILRKKDMHYDTREFHKVVFGEPFKGEPKKNLLVKAKDRIDSFLKERKKGQIRNALKSEAVKKNTRELDRRNL